MKLEHKFACLMFGFILAYMGVMQGCVYLSSRQYARETAQVHLRQQAREIAARVDTLLRDKVRMLSAVAALPIVREALVRTDAEDADPYRQVPRAGGAAADALAQYLRQLVADLHGQFEAVFLADHQGRLVASSAASYAPGLAVVPWWNAVHAAGLERPFIEARGIAPDGRGHGVGIAIPIVEEGRLAGIFRADLDLEGDLADLLQDASTVGERAARLLHAGGERAFARGHATLLSRAETDIARRLRRLQEDAVWMEAGGRWQLLAGAVVPITNNDGEIGFGVNYRSYAHAFDAQDARWMILLSADQAIVDAPHRREFFRSLGLAAAYALLMAVAALLLGRSMARPIVRLLQYAERVGQGEFGVVIDSERNDETGVLVRAFVDLAARLREMIRSRDRLAAEIERRAEIEDRLRAMSITDELTGLYNRRGLFSLAEERVKLARRHDEDLYLLYADIDGLKAVNDSLGHEAGDEMIREISAALKHTFRESDIVSRIGGDEFAVLAGECRGGDFMATAVDRLSQHLAQINARPGRRYALSISIGVVACDLRAPFSLDAHLSRSDAMMYSHKRRGRD